MKGSSLLVLFVILVVIVIALSLSGMVDFDAMFGLPRVEGIRPAIPWDQMVP